MKYLFVILICVLFTSCNQEELQKQNEAYFIDLIKNQIEMNDEMVLKVFFRVEKIGSKQVDIRVYQDMLTLKRGRNKLLEGALLNNFEYLNDTLITKYQSFIRKICEKEDSFVVNKLVKQELIPIQEFNQLQKTPSKFQKILWTYQCMNLEHKLLEGYDMRVGSCSFSIRADTFSDTNPQVGKPFEILISSIPSRFEGMVYDGEHYVLVPSFESWIDGKEVQIEYELECIEDVGVIRFTPPKNGKYHISGGFHIQFDNGDHHRTLYKMIHNFEVK